MILLWFKIIWYKINKRRDPAAPGTEPRVGARVTVRTPPPFPYDEARCASCDELADDCTCMPGENSTEFSLPPVTMNPERLADLYRRGLVYAPTENEAEDRLRAQLFAADRDRRMERAFFDQAACPCSGRHYPTADSCRWCTCHDPHNVHHRQESVGIMKVIQNPGESPESVERLKEQIMGLAEIPVRPSNEIVCCSLCQHPQHTAGNGLCAFLSRDGAGFTLCHCAGQVEVIDTDEATDAAWNSFLGLDQGGRESAEAPSDEIVKCRVCGHPEHTVNVFWCPGSVPSAEPSGGIEACRCDGTRILGQDGPS